MKVKVQAPSNIAFVKYWGKDDPQQNWPSNDSLSMSLAACTTETTLEIAEQDSFTLNGELIDLSKHAKISRHLQRCKESFQWQQGARIVSTNSFPTGCGIASSASGMAALTAAFAVHSWGALPDLGMQGEIHPKLAELARLGSGSACRSLAGGFVQWNRGMQAEDQSVYQAFPPKHWELRDLIILVSQREKQVSSSQGHLSAQTSALYKFRSSLVPERLCRAKDALKAKDLSALGPILEAEATDMHGIMMTQEEPLQYFTQTTLQWIAAIRQIRQEHRIQVYFTLDAGPNLHLILESDQEAKVVAILTDMFGSFPHLSSGVADSLHYQIDL